MEVERITVISLDRTPQRLRRFVELNSHLSIDLFSAVDGHDLDRGRCIESGLIASDNLYTPGALGSAASHVALWRRCVDSKRPIHIAEDDAVIRHDFAAVAGGMLARLPSWDYVLWGWNFDWPMKLQLGPGLGTAILEANQNELRQEWRSFQASRPAATLARLVTCSGTCCYSLSPDGARRLLERALPVGAAPAAFALNAQVTVANTSLDIELSRHFEALEAYVAIPCLAMSLNVHGESTIYAN